MHGRPVYGGMNFMNRLDCSKQIKHWQIDQSMWGYFLNPNSPGGGGGGQLSSSVRNSRLLQNLSSVVP